MPNPVHISQTSDSSLGRVLALYEENLTNHYGIIWEDDKYYPKISIVYDAAKMELKNKKEQVAILIKLYYKKLYSHRRIYETIKKAGGVSYLMQCWVKEKPPLHVLNGKGNTSFWISIVIEAYKLLDAKLASLESKETSCFKDSFSGTVLDYDEFPAHIQEAINNHDKRRDLKAS